MYMYLYDLIICDNNNGITDRLQIRLKLILLLQCDRRIKHNKELCTICKFDLLICLCFNIVGCSCTFRCLFHRLSFLDGVIHFFAEQCIHCTFHNLHQTLSAGIHNSRLF